MQGLVMTVSLKLKVEQRERLYYNQYVYKAVTNVPGAYYTDKAKTVDEYRDIIDKFRTDMLRYPIYTPKNMTDIDYDNIELLINYNNDFKKNNKGTTRREGNSLVFYSNDLDLLKTAPSTSKPLKLYQAAVLPDGVKYFKRKVPAPFRVHLKETRVNTELRQDIFDYINKTAGVEGSGALMIWLTRTSSWPQVWSTKSFYINYTDSSQLTMMHILFSEVIGKNYKLEQQ
jgi:hypothetical protein